MDSMDQATLVRSLLTITKGLPGCGKTTMARKFCKEKGAYRVNRDDLRQMMFGEDVLSSYQEHVVTIAQQAAVKALLLNGRDVIVDDTNLHPLSVPQWRELANECAAVLSIIDMTAIPIDTCKARNALRGANGGRYVPDHVIDKMAERI